MFFFTSTPTAAKAAEASTVDIQGQVVLILCGLVASGKSTFAEALQHHYPHFRRCNQDDLGERWRVEELAYETLKQGFSVCIDRTNFNASQRSHWIEIAREFPGTKIWVIVFDTPFEICAQRLKTRRNHPTILNPQQGLSILTRFAADFQHPDAREGHDRIVYIKPSDHASPVYTRDEVGAILQRVQNSPTPVIQSSGNRDTYNNYSSRGNSSSRGSNRGRRGGWGNYREPYSRQHQHVPNGLARGGYLSTGPSTHPRGQNSYHRGNSVGIYGTGRGITQYLPTVWPSQTNTGEPSSHGKGTENDPLVID